MKALTTSEIIHLQRVLPGYGKHFRPPRRRKIQSRKALALIWLALSVSFILAVSL